MRCVVQICPVIRAGQTTPTLTLPRSTVQTGDMGNRRSETWVTHFGQTDASFERSASHALEGGFDHVPTSGICHVCEDAGSEHRGLVSSVLDQPQDGLQMDRSIQRRPGAVGSFASAAYVADSDARGGGAGVLDLRARHPAWGARKLRRRLLDLDRPRVPAASVVHAILLRHGLIDAEQSDSHRPFERFERPEPNDLWQMDYKGHFATDQGRCHPLTMLDDHSRFNLTLKACGDEQNPTVKSALIAAFERYGMPRCLLADNGAPWGACGQESQWTQLGAWLVRLGITLIHGRPSHPQTQGKEERFHRTLKAEVLGTRRFRDLRQVQEAFDEFRPIYNHQRPHEALSMEVPASRYRPGMRLYPKTLPPVEYGPGDTVRKVDELGKISLHGQPHRVGRAFAGQPVAVRPSEVSDVMSVFYCHQKVARIDLRDESEQG
jgi:transposase InsO family protein